MVCAVEAVGREVLLVKGSEILGQVDLLGLGPQGAVVRLSSDAFDRHLAILLRQAGVREGVEAASSALQFRFCPSSGAFLDSNLGGREKVDLERWLDDVSIVDAQNFGYGLVPAAFSVVPGFGAAMSMRQRYS